jgi:hypothetical protein
MKRCPTCQRTYTDESLRFCLQDGTLLLDDASASFDPNATLAFTEGTPVRDEPPPTEVLGPQAAHTLRLSTPAPTAASQPPRATVRAAPEGFAPPPPAQPKTQSNGLVIGLTVTVAILLLVLGSVGAWMLLRNDKSDGKKGTLTGENRNDTASSSSANSSGRANSNANTAQAATPTPAPSPTATLPPVELAAIRDEVTATLNGWAAASMAHDIEKHMSYYADTLDAYYTSTNVSASRVRADRERAYETYSTIDIRLSNIKVAADAKGEHATATFDKTWNFEGSKYSSGSVQQRIWLVKTGGRWLITGEKDLQVYYVNK